MLRKVPHTYVIVFFIIILSAILTWIMPGGEYVEKTVVDSFGQQTQTLEYQQVDANPQTWQIFSAMFQGFERQAGIIIFILMIGGAFWIMNESKAIDVGIMSFLSFTKRVEHYKTLNFIGINNIVITLVMLLFSIFGAVFGMSEETIAFVIILVPLSISMGYDSIVGVGMVFVAAGLGFAGAVLNPFTIGIAQGLAGLPLFSGFEYRLFCWAIINMVGITYILLYAKKIKKNPSSSLVYTDDEYWRHKARSGNEVTSYYTSNVSWITYLIILAILAIFSYQYPVTELSLGQESSTLPAIPIATAIYAIGGFIALRKTVHLFVLHLLITTILFLIIGVMGYEWYIMKIAALFFAMGIFSGIAMSYNADKITKLFLDGAKDIMSAALIVGLAGGIIAILEDGMVIDTILHKLSQGMQDFGKVASIGVMYTIQTIINIVIPSGSAKAALTMPIMAPFSDLINISRQATVMAFQFGDGFTNMITPTSGVLIGVIGVAKIPYDKWVRWVWPLILIMMILGFLLLIPTVTMELNGF